MKLLLEFYTFIVVNFVHIPSIEVDTLWILTNCLPWTNKFMFILTLNRCSLIIITHGCLILIFSSLELKFLLMIYLSWWIDNVIRWISYYISRVIIYNSFSIVSSKWVLAWSSSLKLLIFATHQKLFFGSGCFYSLQVTNIVFLHGLLTLSKCHIFLHCQ